MSALSFQVLEALLSPDASLRSAAEAELARLQPEAKCQAFLTWLQVLPILPPSSALATMLSSSTSSSGVAAVRQLICVLLRREILKITATAVLKQLVDPLLRAFARFGEMVEPRDVRSLQELRLLGDCIAAVLQGLEQLASANAAEPSSAGGEDLSKQACQHVLQAIGTQASQGRVDCLHLLVEIARSSPRAFCDRALPSFPVLVSTVLTTCQRNNSRDEREATLGELAWLIVQAAVASAAVVGAANAPSSPSPLSPSLLAPAVRGTTVRGGQHGAGGISDTAFDSVATQLGESCWLPLLEALGSSPVGFQGAVGVLREPLITAVEAVPALVMQPVVLAATMRFLGRALDQQQKAQPPPSHDQTPCGADELRSVQVVASLLNSSPETRHQVLSESAGTGLLMESCLITCLRCLTACPFCVVLQEAVDFLDDDADDGEDEEERDTVLYAEQLLESLVHSLGAPAVQVVLSHISSYQQQHRPSPAAKDGTSTSRWCLAALRCCAWAAPVSLFPRVEMAIEWALNKSCLGNCSPLLFALHERCEAVVLLGALVVQYPTLRGQHATRILEQVNTILSEALSVATTTPVAAVYSALVIASCRVLVSLCRGDSEGRGNGYQDSVDPNLLLPHLSVIMPSLVMLFQQSSINLLVRIQAIATIACLSDVVGSQFRGYYSSVVPLLLQTIISTGNFHPSPSLAPELRGMAMEAASIIGKAVDDVELYGPDAIQLLRIATHELQQQSPDRVDYIPPDLLVAACARIASVIKEDYAPYAEVVLTHLLQRATDPSDVELSEGNESGLEAFRGGQVEHDDAMGSESMTVALPGRGLTKVTIHTSKIQDKVVAIRALYEHAKALGPAFYPWCQTCLDAMGAMVNFPYSADLRGSVAQTLAAVYDAACTSGAQVGSMEISGRYLPVLASRISKQIVNEDESADIETLHAEADALSEILHSVYLHLEHHGEQLLAHYAVRDAQQVVQQCMSALVSCLKRRDKIASSRYGLKGIQPSDDEIQELDHSLRGEEELLIPLVDSVGYNLKLFRQDFLPSFERFVAPVLAQYLQLQPGKDHRARVAAICLFDDCIEHCGIAAASKFAPMLVEGATLGLDDDSEDQDLLRASIYGIAQICRNSPSSVLRQFEAKILTRLVSIVQGVKNNDNKAVYEYAISALASLTLFGMPPFMNSQFMDRNEVLPILLQNSPLTVDYDESKYCNAGLCDLVEKGAIPIDASTCSVLLRIIGEVMLLTEDGEMVATNETCLRFTSFLFRMQQEIPREYLQECFATLSPDSQASVQNAMVKYADKIGAVVTP